MNRTEERIAQLVAHRICHAAEHDPIHGRIHGYCIVCGIPWPCEVAAVLQSPSVKSVAVASLNLDEIEAQLDSTVPYYVPQLIAEIRRLTAVLNGKTKEQL